MRENIVYKLIVINKQSVLRTILKGLWHIFDKLKMKRNRNSADQELYRPRT